MHSRFYNIWDCVISWRILSHNGNECYQKVLMIELMSTIKSNGVLLDCPTVLVTRRNLSREHQELSCQRVLSQIMSIQLDWNILSLQFLDFKMPKYTISYKQWKSEVVEQRTIDRGFIFNSTPFPSQMKCIIPKILSGGTFQLNFFVLYFVYLIVLALIAELRLLVFPQQEKKGSGNFVCLCP